MTFEQAFEKAAMDRFEEVKMAGLGDLMKSLGGVGGIGRMFEHGNIAKSVGSGWRGLSDVQRARATGQLIGGLGAGLYGYSQTDPRDSGLKHLLNAGLYGMGGALAGGMAGGAIHDFNLPST